MLLAGDENLVIGGDTATPMSNDATPAAPKFTGNLPWVQLDGVATRSHI